ncbi:MAG TPA: PKD domain-containing protein [Chryseosolibacter sp.]|nr:PKD domain-containing protein [Chryseosolibacter sp.]
MQRVVNPGWLLIVLPIFLIVFSCKEDDPEPLPIASFQFEKDPTDFAKVSFMNFSQNFKTLSWDFGDGTAPVTEENPIHTFAAEGTFTVKLTATNGDGMSSEKTEEIIISDPQSELKKLTGTTSKSWKLLRDVSGGQFPMVVGNQARTVIHWSFGGVTPLGERQCALNDEFIFALDGTYTYESNGDVFADAGDFGPWSNDIGSVCVPSVDENFVGKNNVDLSAWNDAVHAFTYNSDQKKLTVTGLGAFVGLQKVGTGVEVTSPQQSVTYDVVRLVDSQVDTLILESLIGTANYWRFILVHYDNPAQEPAMPVAPPVANFDYEVSGGTVTFENTSSNGQSWDWDFGDGTAHSTEKDPVHTYSSNGSFTVKLIATNAAGSSTATKMVAIGAAPCTPEAAASLNPSTGIKFTLDTDNPKAVFGGFGGVNGGRVENPFITGINQSCYVNQYHRGTSGCEVWGGAAVGLETAINFATDKKKFKLKVYAATKVSDVVLRLERLAYPDTEPSAERTATITATAEWQELTFDFSDITDPNTYKNIVIYFDKGSCGEEVFFYFDDLEQVN